MLLEVCVDNFESACAAINAGAGRLELCSALSEGGLTPTPGILKQIQIYNNSRVPIFCMLRCRSGDFHYTQEEISIMIEDAQILKQNGANGFVFGALQQSGDIDMKKCRDILRTCYPLPVTFSRAFDLCVKPSIELHVIIDVGFARVLTSGQKKSAKNGVPLIRKLVDEAQGRIIIVPGAGINKDNITYIATNTGAKEFHGSFRKLKDNKTDDEDEDEVAVQMGDSDDGSLKIADEEHIAEVVSRLKHL